MSLTEKFYRRANAQMSDARATLAQVLSDLAGFVPIATAEIKVGKRYDIKRPIGGSFDFWHVEVLSTPQLFTEEVRCGLMVIPRGHLEFDVTDGRFAEGIHDGAMIREVA